MIQKQQNEVLGHPLPVSTYLLKPFQRILKYPELLKVIFSVWLPWTVGRPSPTSLLEHVCPARKDRYGRCETDYLKLS